MAETLQQMKNQLNEFWTGLEKGKKTKLIIGSLFVILSITAIILFTTRTNYVPLYSTALTAREAGIVTEKLDQLGVSWEEGDMFNSILVPSNQKSRIMRELAKDGFPNDGLSFSNVIENDSITMTGDTREWMRNQALANELSNSIKKFEGVDDATVYIHKPEEKGFVLNNDEEATAAVMIERAIRMPISTQTISSIQALVANAVGMKPENVSVADDAGNLLSDQNSSENGFNFSDQLSLQYNLQSSLDNTIDKFLETVFGYGNVAVTTSVKVNFDSEITNITEFAPPIEGNEEGLIRSLQKMRESTVNTGTGGVPGTESNTGDVTDYVQQDSNTVTFDKASETINFELDQINRQISKAPGEIESTTVAVLINSDALADGELTDENKKQITELIYAATGLDTKNVVVSAQKFSISNIEPYSDFQAAGFNIAGNIPLIAGLLLVFLALGGLAGFYINKRRKANEKADLEKMIQERTDAMSEIEEIDFESEKSQVKKQIGIFVDRKPDSVAQLLRSWLNEE